MGDLWGELSVLANPIREAGYLARTSRLRNVGVLHGAHYVFRFPAFSILLQSRYVDRPFEELKYGETPWFTAEAILRKAGLKPGEQFLDLGCGTGKMVFTAALAFEARAVGVELLPSYLSVAEKLKRWCRLDNCAFQLDDFTQVGLGEADVVFLTANALTEETRRDLLQRFRTLKTGARLMTVDWAIEGDSHLKLVSSERFLFSWGRDTVYFHEAGRMEPSEATSNQVPAQ